jgi:hypothetical protein
MFKSRTYQDKAAEFRQRADAAREPHEQEEFRNAERSFATLAQNELWLAKNYDKTLHGGQEGQTPAELAAEEEHILRCLGAALIMQWTTIPTKLQRELFDTAGAMGDLLTTPELRGQIARFLHKHKDGDRPTRHVRPEAVQMTELYHSPNGDRWHLVRDSESGRAFVRHEPNRASGGTASDLDIDTFLNTGGDGPEKQALRDLMQDLRGQPQE